MSTSQAVALAEMLKLVERRELARCRDAMARAEQEAQALRRQAHRTARERMRRHLQELKRHRDREMARARAELDTARRQHQQRCDAVLLDAAERRLRAVLLAFWGEEAPRRQWVEHLLREASARLPRGHWTIAHPAGWAAAEREALTRQLEQELGAAPAFTEDARVGAGLRFCAGRACLDGTLDGLLAGRAAVEAMLLAEMSKQD